MALAGQVLPQPQVARPKTVDRAVGQLDVDLPAEHAHPAAAWSGMKLRELGGLVDLDGTAGAGF